MSGKANTIRIDRRRQETRDEVVAAAWDLVRERGLAGLSLRDLGERVGMRAQSLYSYFASKHEIYDALFLDGYRAFAEWMDAGATLETLAADPVTGAKLVAHRFFSFCTGDPVRYQLLFQRTIPDFEPSEESYAVAIAAYEASVLRLRAIGLDDPVTMDLWTAVTTGLTSQQLSNDPGGDRWERLVDRAVHMLMVELAPHLIAGTEDGGEG